MAMPRQLVDGAGDLDRFVAKLGPPTRATLDRWRRRPAAALGPWALASFGVAVLLLSATWIVAMLSEEASFSMPPLPMRSPAARRSA